METQTTPGFFKPLDIEALPYQQSGNGEYVVVGTTGRYASGKEVGVYRVTHGKLSHVKDLVTRQGDMGTSYGVVVAISEEGNYVAVGTQVKSAVRVDIYVGEGLWEHASTVYITSADYRKTKLKVTSTGGVVYSYDGNPHLTCGPRRVNMRNLLGVAYLMGCIGAVLHQLVLTAFP